jgi:ubiquitin-small subunit ribosomal protein S27Ae
MVENKKTKSSKGEVAVYKYYNIQENKVTRTKRECPRCGKGVFMAQHKDRFSCGKCGFTEFSQKETKKGNKKQQ